MVKFEIENLESLIGWIKQKKIDALQYKSESLITPEFKGWLSP
jgi:hypothetical protein